MSEWWEHPLLYTRGGSHAYGLATPESDIDERGVAFPPIRWILGFSPAPTSETHEGHVPHDVVVHSLRKFLSLALKGNPNILEILFCRDEDILTITPVGESLRTMRGEFLTQQSYQSLGGYAAHQLYRMRHHASTHGTHAPLIAQFGYDTKNAMHLIRLLRMGYELLTTGTLSVYRSDREELLAIRRGEFSEEDIQRMAQDLDQRCQEALKTTDLPVHPNREKIEAWLMGAQFQYVMEGEANG